jgi:hypothetical protein
MKVKVNFCNEQFLVLYEPIDFYEFHPLISDIEIAQLNNYKLLSFFFTREEIYGNDLISERSKTKRCVSWSTVKDILFVCQRVKLRNETICFALVGDYLIVESQFKWIVFKGGDTIKLFQRLMEKRMK